MDIGLTMLPVFSAKACLNAGTYGTMGLGLGQAIAAAIVHPDRPVIHLSGDSAIGFSGRFTVTVYSVVRFRVSHSTPRPQALSRLVA
jgi:2-hydroxyacyl-CoA lyase 1